MLPEYVDTVTVTGRYLTPAGEPLTGSLVWRAPGLITFDGPGAESDVMLSGPVTVPLDATGSFAVTLPATDAPGMDPIGWAYTVTEQLVGVASNRSYSVLLPRDVPEVNLADIAPTDPSKGTYVRGASAYEVAVAEGFTGTPEEWLASLVGPMGPAGPIASVNGDTGPEVILTAADVGAVPDTEPGAPGGIAQLDQAGRLTAAQRPTYTAAEVGAIPLSQRGAADGVASLGTDGKVPAEQLPAASGGTSTLPVIDPTAPTYGAIGDGTTDDAPALQAALNAARDAGGAWIILRPGIYTCATLPLRIYRGTRLTLAPGAVLRRGAPNTFLLNGNADQTFGGYTGHGDLIIEGGLWDMRATDAPTNPDMCISIGHARNVTIRDLEIRDVGGYHAIELNSTKHAVISGCQFRGYIDTGGRDFSEAVQFDGAFRSSVFGGFGPYDGTPCEDVVMRDCYVGPSDTAGTVAWPAGVGSHSAAAGVWHRRIRIESNSFEDGAQYAVKPYIWESSTVSGNTIKGMGAGVWARTLDSSKTADRTTMAGVNTGASQHSYGLVIADNTFRAMGSYNDAIYLQGESTGRWYDVTVTGNTVNGVAGSENGIRAEYVERFVFGTNVLDDIGGTGISTANCGSGLVTGNRLIDCGGSFFTSDSGTHLMVSGNHASDCNSHGFWAWSNTNLRISDNFIRGAGRTDATAQGIRLSTGGDRVTVTNNTYRMWGSGTEATSVYTCTSAVTNVRRWGNDWLGQGTVTSTAANENLSPYDAGTP